MTFLIKYVIKKIGGEMIKRLLISWLFAAVFDALIGYAERLAKKTDTDIDDDAVQKFKDNRQVFINYAKGKV